MIAKKKQQPETPATKTIRCAIYTRKSTEEGLEKEFNTLDAQRECAENYVRSQAGEGWIALPDRYDDGGFSGGNMDRPALKRLLADIEAGKIDCIVVYKVDRLSRSLLDFAKMVETFDRHQVSFVSVTQLINTSNSMGRLMLNVLLSFAQFEREIISERTRDKIAAARRKGKWSGGMPILGYDVDPQTSKLVVNEDESLQVRAIFNLYLELGSLLPVVQELRKRNWTMKRWMKRDGCERGGKPFVKTSLHKLLSNVAYLGKVRYKSEVHDGEHAAIVDVETWEKVQARLRHNCRTGGAGVRNKFGALLKGILRCTACDCSMVPSHSTKQGSKRYRYYVCSSAQKRGWHTCPAPSVPAGEIERFLVERIRGIGDDEALVSETCAELTRRSEERLKLLGGEVRTLQRAVQRRTNADMPPIGEELDQLRADQQRLTELRQDAEALKTGRIEDEEVAAALSAFTPLWESLSPREQVRVMQLIVARVDYDGKHGKLGITFQPTGLKTLAAEVAV
jgi:site-specific DNA recombinase